MQPASTAEPCFTQAGIDVSIDNNPGDGAQGWIWSRDDWATSAHVIVWGIDGSSSEIWLGVGGNLPWICLSR
ncbi:hypothetical protein [Streptomyces sp. NPDC002265]|uniref:hypothetical protein n=1 Tax=Streptomyces sp. NPDC002265 TaxID=3154415 RepID=UPI0033329259